MAVSPCLATYCSEGCSSLTHGDLSGVLLKLTVFITGISLQREDLHLELYIMDWSFPIRNARYPAASFL